MFMLRSECTRHLRTHDYVISVIVVVLLSACSADSLDSDTTEETPTIGAATPVQGQTGNTDTQPTVVVEPPVVVEQPVEPAEPVNLAPVITDTSYQCDPVVDSVVFSVGQSDTFTLRVDDESPLTLTYEADSSNMLAVAVDVDNNGIFTVTALQSGESYLWLTAEDENGLTDEYELRVYVN